MRPTIRGSDVFVKEDLRAIIDSLDIAARHQPSGCWREGWLAATNAVRTAIGIDVEQPEIVTVHEVTEYRHERIEQRYAPPAPPAERQFKIVGQRAQQIPADMTGDDVNITVFNPQAGRLVERSMGYGWIGNDGTTAYWAKSDWQQIQEAEATAWGELLPENWLMLARHAYANDKRRQLGQSVRVLPTDRRQLR